MVPRETENNAYAKFWGDKERALWYVMVFSGVVNWIFLWIKLFYLVRTLVPTIYMGEPVGSRQY